MSLQVWLPLNGDLHNQGLNGAIVATGINPVAYNNSGKIGKCYQRATTNASSVAGIQLNTNLVDTFNKTASVAMWVKPLGTHTHYNGTLLSSGNWNNKCWAFGVSQDNSKVDVLCGGYNKYITCPIPVNQWTHLISTFDNGTCKVYKNGVYVGTLSGQAAFNSDATTTCIGRETYAGGYFGFNGLINDVRIYDHVLSAKEVEEIAKGLILHYKLDDETIEPITNMLTASQSLTTGGWQKWSSSGATAPTLSYVTIDGHKCCKAVYTTQQSGWTHCGPYIGTATLEANKTYTFSCFIKAADVASVGKKVSIQAWNNNGIYVTNHCNRPRIALTNQWQRVESTIRLSQAQTAMIGIGYGYWANGNAGVSFYVTQLQWEKREHMAPIWIPGKTTYTNKTIYDCSGYSNNGTISGSLAAAAGSPRYDIATYIADGRSQYIVSPTLNLPGDAITMNFWFKSANKAPTGSYHMPLESKSQGHYEISISSGGTFRGGLYINGQRQVDNGTSSKMTDGKWHMGTMTFDGSIIKRYVDGVMEKSTSITGTLSTSQSFIIGHYGDNIADYGTKEGYESDVRIYTTALTEAQVKELYTTSMSVDSSGNVYARKLSEL